MQNENFESDVSYEKPQEIIKTRHFMGPDKDVHSFGINVNTVSSWFSFIDEENVRGRFWYPNIKYDDVVYDIGAAFGSYTLPALCLGAQKVVAFYIREGEEEEKDLLQRNLFVNMDLDPKRVIIHNSFGLYSKSGYLNIKEQKFSETKEEGSIEVRRLDDLNIDEVHIDIMKIDVEGAELEVLKGARKTIEKYKPKLLIENHKFMFPDIEDKVIEFLRSLGLGYKYTITPYNEVSHTYCHF